MSRSKLGVDPASGLSAAKAAELLKTNGPNALPAEKPPPGWRLFLAQYKSYMQIILVAAAIASIVIGQIATGVAVLLITALNALGGLRQQGKAESAMNALQSMLKTTARVRRDGTEVKVDADQVVVGDVVLLAAGDDVCADGRLVEATSLQIDESALTGESVPASKSTEVITDQDPVLGDQSNMAFMNTPVTHGSGVMIVTGTGADTAVGNISGMLKSAPNLKTPLTKQLDTLTLWIAAAAGLTIAIMFALGISRGQSTQTIFTTAIALALAAVPMAMPTVLQVILSSGSRDLAAHGAVVKSLDSVETLGSTSAINSDKTGTLTMNQVTVVEVIDPTDRYTITGMGYGLDGEVHHTAGNTNTIEAAILPFLITNDAKLVDGKVVGDPTEGALLVLGHKVKLDIEGTQEAYPRLATLPFDPTYKLMAAFCDAKDESGNPVVRVFVKGAAPAVIGRATSALAKGETVPWGEQQNQRADQEMERLGSKGLRIMAAATKDIDPTGFDPEGDLLSLVQGLQLTALVGMIDPPRPESLDAVRSAQDANIRVRMVTGDDVVTGAAVAKQLGHPRGGHPRHRAGGDVRGRAARPHRRHRRGRTGGPRAQGADGRDPAQEGRGRGHDRRRGQRRPGDQGRRHRHRDGHRHPGREERRPDDPHRRQLRHDRARRVRGPQALRQHAEVHPLHAGRAGHLRGDLPDGEPAQHRRRPALLRRPDPVDQLPDHRSGRHRAGPGQGDPRADEAPAATARGVDHDPGRHHDRRPGRPVHVRRDRPADRVREERVRQRPRSAAPWAWSRSP